MNIKLNIFKVVLSVFIFLYVLALLFYILITFTGGHTIPKELFRFSFFGTSIKPYFFSYFLITVIIDLLLVYSLIQLLKITDYIKNNFLFTLKIISLLKVVGKCFVIIGVIGFLASLFYHYCFSENFLERMLLPFFYHFMVFIIGLGILIIEEIQKRAFLIKSENDLTI